MNCSHPISAPASPIISAQPEKAERMQEGRVHAASYQFHLMGSCPERNNQRGVVCSDGLIRAANDLPNVTYLTSTTVTRGYGLGHHAKPLSDWRIRAGMPAGAVTCTGCTGRRSRRTPHRCVDRLGSRWRGRPVLGGIYRAGTLGRPRDHRWAM